MALSGLLQVSGLHQYITRNKKRINSMLKQQAMNVYVLATPIFEFTTDREVPFEENLRPAQVHFFLEHSILLPGKDTRECHVFANVSWPMVHPN